MITGWWGMCVCVCLSEGAKLKINRIFQKPNDDWINSCLKRTESEWLECDERSVRLSLSLECLTSQSIHQSTNSSSLSVVPWWISNSTPFRIEKKSGEIKRIMWLSKIIFITQLINISNFNRADKIVFFIFCIIYFFQKLLELFWKNKYMWQNHSVEKFYSYLKNYILKYILFLKIVFQIF